MEKRRLVPIEPPYYQPVLLMRTYETTQMTQPVPDEQ